MVLALCMRPWDGGVCVFSLGHSPMVVLMALHGRNQSNGHSTRHHGVRAEQDQRPADSRYFLCTITANQSPSGAHHDVALKQQDCDSGGVHDLGLACRRAEGSTRGPGQDPQRG
ncbi:hypothetical protein MCHLDSM_03851 [Mycolicibacterium chlorophenolicum]|uniref:Uncharacterized protein n=1 Tax=Mycolicibacterium chlorophenolicum TaxID=37916 RepID=A0A0J6YJ26_9MYCO|nr:hypothetical protein MCHLDSM_03851 [Mycolicibacterium chlorophenolicum]